MQATHFIHIRLAQGHKFSTMWLDTLLSSFTMIFGKCSPHFKHNFALSRFNYQIWQYKFAQMCYAITTSRPKIYLFSRIIRYLFSSSSTNKSTKSSKQPINKLFVGIGNLNVGLI